MNDEEVDAFLEHHGVKGMHWGVRDQERLDRVSRVARGTASKDERAQFLLTETSALSLIKNRGIKGSASKREKQLIMRKRRIKAGRATVLDFLALHGGDKLVIT